MAKDHDVRFTGAALGQDENSAETIELTFTVRGVPKPFNVVVPIKRTRFQEEDVIAVGKDAMHQIFKRLARATESFELGKTSYDALVKRGPDAEAKEQGG